MEQQPINYGQVIKREHVGYMKHAASLYNGEMILTDLRIMVKSYPEWEGLLGTYLARNPSWDGSVRTPTPP